MVFNTLNRPNPDEGSNTGVCLTDFTGQNKRNDKRPIADTVSPLSPILLGGGKGETDFFTSLFNFALSCWSPYLLTFNTYTHARHTLKNT